MDLMTIGAFAERTRLSPKALRLYDRLGLLQPVRTDASNGYRFYSEDQVELARLVALLRRLDMPLPVIAEIMAQPSPQAAARAVGDYWERMQSIAAERQALVSYIQARLAGEITLTSYDIQTRSIGSRTILSISRHVYMSQTDAFFGSAFAALRAGGPGLTGIEGCPFLIFYGEVSDDSDGPLELCRPVAASPAHEGIESREEPEHTEVFIRLAKKDMNWSAMAPAVDALEAWARQQDRQPSGPLRQVLIADQRTATPETLVCDLTVPLR
jgi:DNA-binding transcriptional MerR regulator